MWPKYGQMDTLKWAQEKNEIKMLCVRRETNANTRMRVERNMKIH